MASRISRKRLQRLTVLCALLLGAATAPLAQQPAAEGMSRVVAVGDIHGDFDAFVSVLREAPN